MKEKSSVVARTLRLILPLLAGAVAAVFVMSAGVWLKVTDQVPESIDYVFTFASERQRVDYSRELMTVFPKAHWILSDYKFGQARLLKRDGFDMNRLATIDTCSSTYSEVTALADWLKDNKITDRQHYSIALVSSPYHMRRINMMVSKVFKNSDIAFYYLPVPLERYKWNHEMFKKWWRNESVRNVVISELQKILYYWLFFSVV